MTDEKDASREADSPLHTLFKKLKVNTNCKVPKRLTNERSASRKSAPALHGCPRVRPYNASRSEPDNGMPSIESLTLVREDDNHPVISSVRTQRPLIQAARLRLPPSSDDQRTVLRPAKLLSKAKRPPPVPPVSFVQTPCHTPSHPDVPVFAEDVRRPPADFHTLAARCVGTTLADSYVGPSFQHYDCNVSAVPSASAVVTTSTPSSCSVEARCDDWSVEELSCYFEDCVNIPKKMSAMAEMMYT